MQPSTVQSFEMKNENKEISRQTKVNLYQLSFTKEIYLW